jgi:hypothetical protein
MSFEKSGLRKIIENGLLAATPGRNRAEGEGSRRAEGEGGGGAVWVFCFPIASERVSGYEGRE